MNVDNQNGGTTSVEAQELMAAGGPESLDGYSSAAPEDALAERPELLVGGAFVAGLLLGALVSRLGS
jgi:hypothetical protein